MIKLLPVIANKFNICMHLRPFEFTIPVIGSKQIKICRYSLLFLRQSRAFNKVLIVFRKCFATCDGALSHCKNSPVKDPSFAIDVAFSDLKNSPCCTQKSLRSIETDTHARFGNFASATRTERRDEAELSGKKRVLNRSARSDCD